MQTSSWVVDGEQPKKPKAEASRMQLKHRQAFEITDKTTKAQIDTIEGWNEMRQCLLDNGLMKSN